MLGGTPAAMLVGTFGPEIYSKLRLHIPLVGTSQVCLLVRPQKYLLVRVGKKILSAFPLPLALLGTKIFYVLCSSLVHPQHKSILSYVCTFCQLARVRHAWRHFTSDKKFDQWLNNLILNLTSDQNLNQ